MKISFLNGIIFRLKLRFEQMKLINSALLALFLVLVFFNGISQGLEMGPMMKNTQLNHQFYSLKTNETTFDSSFVFISDTLQMPFFDDFSTNKFQTYQGDINAAGITSELYFRLTDPISNLPLPDNEVFTNQVTFKRVYDFVSNTYEDSLFLPTQVRVSDLSIFPVQNELINLYPPFYLFDSIGGPSNLIDTVWVVNPPYFQDSARIFFQPISDPSKHWLDTYAYHNYRLALDPRSLGVVTFDGLDENGYPYEIGSTATNFADELTSKPLDLSSNSAADSIYFSFLYQPEGLGDIPESGDSLIVEFYQPLQSNWKQVWSVAGETVHPFRAAHICLEDTSFFRNGFQFRFRNYGSLAGSLDHFHIDYVHLRSLSALDDTLFKDFAFVYPLNSMLKTFTAVPWDHYKASSDNKMADSLAIKLHNGSPNPENYQNGDISILYNSIQEGTFVLPGFILAESNINYQPRITHLSLNDCSSGYEFDRSKIGNQQSFEVKASASAQFPNLTINDSTVFNQNFYNYYSYDDGSAEAAFGPTGSQARLAIEYNTYQPDSLIGVNIHFVPSVNDASDKLFLITVWEDNGGVPGNVLYEDDVFFPRNPTYGNAVNLFHTYYFVDTAKIAVGNKFHIGWRQLDPDRLNAGLDRNIDQSNKIRYSVDGGFTWLLSPFPGSAMIRPIFSTALDPILGINEIQEAEEMLIYPNPTNGTLNFKLNGTAYYGEFQLMNAVGQILQSGLNSSVDLIDYLSGIYYLTLPQVSTKVYKISKQ